MCFSQSMMAALVGALGGAFISFLGTSVSFLLAWIWVTWQYPGYTVDYPAALLASMTLWTGAACAAAVPILVHLFFRPRT